MINHFITKYTENGKLYAESWIQINLFGKVYCFSKRRILVEKVAGKGGFDKLCKACKKEYDRRRYLDNQERFRQEKKEYYWKSKAKRKRAEYPAGTGTAK